MTGPWRDPDEETIGLYPGLVVHDGRVTGSITIGQSRLPVWAILGEYCQNGWDGVLNGWDYIEDDYGFTNDDLARFLYCLLEARGEFGRLLLMLADAERQEQDRDEAEVEAHFAEMHPGKNVCECGTLFRAAWWETPDLAAPVIDQLRRCLAVLEGVTP